MDCNGKLGLDVVCAAGGGKGEGLAVPVGDKLGVLPVEPLGVLAHQAEESEAADLPHGQDIQHTVVRIAVW